MSDWKPSKKGTRSYKSDPANPLSSTIKLIPLYRTVIQENLKFRQKRWLVRHSGSSYQVDTLDEANEIAWHIQNPHVEYDTEEEE